MPKTKPRVPKIFERDGAAGQGRLCLLCGPAKVQVDGGVATARRAQMFRQSRHALEILRVVRGVWLVPLRQECRKATPALNMTSREVQVLRNQPPF